MYEDKTLVCRDCGNEFVFTASEQQWYAERGYNNDPGRCPSCRQARRAARGGSERGEREMFDWICADCGQPCQVPFRPREGGKPVYCRACLANHQNRF